MKKTILTISAFVLLASCTHKYTPVSSSMINITDYNIGDTGALKTGEACRITVFGFSAAETSTSIIDAMKEGEITKIKMVDRKTTIAPFYYKYCMVVHGL